MSERKIWIETMDRIVRPVLTALSEDCLKKKLPLEFHPHCAYFAPLEAFGRTASGIAPFLALEEVTSEEKELQEEYISLFLKGLDYATNPESNDYMEFDDKHGHQPLVDAAFLSHALIRAKKQLINSLDERVKNNLKKALRKTRCIIHTDNNWIFFTAMVEAALFLLEDSTFDMIRIHYACQLFESWYMGDGIYGDGEHYHWDYYNSFVIQPMYVDLVELFKDRNSKIAELYPKVINRAKRYTSILERMIAPDGTYPIIGRSITYRFGAFQLLSQMSLLHMLPEELKPAQVRSALTAVILKVTESKQMFDDKGFLLPGVYGHQPNLAENYINVGSLYLCTTVFLSLGLPETDEFWRDESIDWTSRKVWSGKLVNIDHAI